MGLEFYVILSRKHENDTCPTVSSRPFVKRLEELDNMAIRVGVKPVTAFIPVTDDLVEEASSQGILPPHFRTTSASHPKWFSPKEGLRTIDALIAEVQRADDGKDVLEFMEYIKSQLLRAIKKEIKFCFELQ
jgi:hypothetical protein